MKAPIDPSEPLFPIRPNEPVCQYYMKHGTCKFGQACKFHHPPQTPVTLGSNSSSGRNAVVMNVSRSERNNSAVPQQTLLNGDTVVQVLPQRPDEPNCIYFQRNGRCKYGASCRYHHPINFHQRKSVEQSRRQPMQVQHVDRTILQGHDGNAVYAAPSVQFTSQTPYVQQQRGPTHVLVADAPITVMSIGGGSQYQNVNGSSLGENEYAVPVGVPLGGLAQDRRPSTSSMASSFENQVSSLEYLSSSLPTTKQDMWGRVPGRTASVNSLSTYGDSPQVRPVGSRVVVGHGGNEPTRRTRAASFSSVGSSSDHSAAMSLGGQHYTHHDGVVGWAPGGSAAMGMPVHQERYATDGGHFEQGRRNHLSYNRDATFDGPIREEPIPHMPQDRGAPSNRRGMPNGRSLHQPTDGGVDQGLSMMTSALLNMLDTPEDATAAMKGLPTGLPSRISSSSTINNAMSPPSTPKSGHVNPPQEPSLLSELLPAITAPQPEQPLDTRIGSGTTASTAPYSPEANGNHASYTPRRTQQFNKDYVPSSQWSPPPWYEDSDLQCFPVMQNAPQQHTDGTSPSSNSNNVGLFLP